MIEGYTTSEMEFEAANGEKGIIREPVEERLRELRSALDEFARTASATLVPLTGNPDVEH